MGVTDSTATSGGNAPGPALPPDAAARWQRLCENPETARWWDWYVLLRLIQAATPDRPRIGRSVQLADEVVRLGQPPFFHPPAFIVSSLTMPRRTGDPTGDFPDGAGEQVPRLQSYHFGLFGPNGPLPLHLTEVAYRQARQKVPAMAAFCDVLHHRFLSFFFRAWADARKEIDFDRPREPALDDPGSGESRPGNSEIHRDRLWELYFGSLIGHGGRAYRHRDAVPDRAKLYHAVRLVRSSRNAEGLQAILEDYFGVPVRVIKFFSRTLRLPPEVNCRLGQNGSRPVGRLGLSAFVGEYYTEHQAGFRIRMGPLRLEQLEEFLPGNSGMEELHDWVRLYMGRESDPHAAAGLEAVWDVQLVLRGPEAPALILGGGVRLGWTSWVQSGPCSRHLEDLVLRPSAAGPRSLSARRRARRRETNP